MKKIKYLIISLVLSLFIIPISALALEKENKDFYIKTGDDVLLEEDVYGSTLVSGDNVEANTEVNGIGFLFGNNIDISKNVDYLITAGNSITINGKIENDAFIAGNIVTISDEATITRDLIIAAKEVNIYGTINRNVKIYASEINVKGAKINGKFDTKVQTLNIDEKTEIIGYLNYNKDAKTNINSKEIGNIITYENKELSQTFIDKLLNNAIIYIGMLLIFLVTALIIPTIFEKIKQGMDKADTITPFKMFAIGLFSLVVMPLLIMLLLISVIGIPLGFLLLALYIISICITSIFICYVIGRLVFVKLFKQEENTLLSGFVGMIILFVLSLIPYINSIVGFISLFIGLGIIITLIKPFKINYK